MFFFVFFYAIFNIYVMYDLCLQYFVGKSHLTWTLNVGRDFFYLNES